MGAEDERHDDRAIAGSSPPSRFKQTDAIGPDGGMDRHASVGDDPFDGGSNNNNIALANSIPPPKPIVGPFPPLAGRNRKTILQ